MNASATYLKNIIRRKKSLKSDPRKVFEEIYLRRRVRRRGVDIEYFCYFFFGT